MQTGATGRRCVEIDFILEFILSFKDRFKDFSRLELIEYCKKILGLSKFLQDNYTECVEYFDIDTNNGDHVRIRDVYHGDVWFSFYSDYRYRLVQNTLVQMQLTANISSSSVLYDRSEAYPSGETGFEFSRIMNITIPSWTHICTEELFFQESLLLDTYTFNINFMYSFLKEYGNGAFTIELDEVEEKHDILMQHNKYKDFYESIRL
ncbi:hypothetical protein [Salmonella phage PHA46]